MIAGAWVLGMHNAGIGVREHESFSLFMYCIFGLARRVIDAYGTGREVGQQLYQPLLDSRRFIFAIVCYDVSKLIFRSAWLNSLSALGCNHKLLLFLEQLRAYAWVLWT